MANPILQYLMIFADNDGWGWTEKHFLQAGSESPNLGIQLGNFVTGVVPLRAALLAKDQAVVGARVSYPGPNAIRSLGNRYAYPGNVVWDSLPIEASLALQLQNANGDAKKIVHMRGLPTVISVEGEYFEDATFKSRLDAYVAALREGYGWPTKDPVNSVSGDVTLYLVDDDTKVTFTVDPTEGDFTDLVGEQIFVRFSRLNNGKSALNKTLLVEVTNPTTLKTVQQVAAAPFLASGHFNYRATTFVRYNQQGSKSIGRRAPGKPLNRQPGRSKAKPLA